MDGANAPELGAQEGIAMASGILVIDKPQGWTSMDVCSPWMPGIHGTPRLNYTSSEEMNSSCGKVLPRGKTLGQRKRAGAWRTGGDRRG